MSQPSGKQSIRRILLESLRAGAAMFTLQSGWYTFRLLRGEHLNDPLVAYASALLFGMLTGLVAATLLIGRWQLGEREVRRIALVSFLPAAGVVIGQRAILTVQPLMGYQPSNDIIGAEDPVIELTVMLYLGLFAWLGAAAVLIIIRTASQRQK
jgi:hypothetical protein